MYVCMYVVYITKTSIYVGDALNWRDEAFTHWRLILYGVQTFAKGLHDHADSLTCHSQLTSCFSVSWQLQSDALYAAQLTFDGL